MAYRVETKLKCLACGFGIFLEEKEGASIACPKCLTKWVLAKEDDELFLEYA